MPMSRQETRTLKDLAIALQASDPELAGLLSAPITVRAVPRRPSRTMSRHERDDSVDFLKVLAAIVLGALPLLLGIYSHTSWLVAAGVPVLVLLPAAAAWWVNRHRPVL